MSRLLFAAARGARIQINGFTATAPRWYDSHKWSSMHESVLRIHPDDEHLQYGPISTALREMAVGKDCREINYASIPSWITTIICECHLDSCWISTWREQSPIGRRTALLILAEALADEGL